MHNLTRRVALFLSSPGDLHDQREVIRTVCEDLSNDLGRSENFVIDLVRWETHSFSAAGESPQDLINKQIGDEYDVFLGMLGSRFGTSTKNFDSGTEEEFCRAIDRFKSTGSPEIMFFFYETAIHSGSVDARQLAKVQDFRSTLSGRGVLYSTFSDAVSLYRLAHRQIHQTVRKLLAQSTDGRPSDGVLEASASFDPLAEWNELLRLDTEVHASVLMQDAANALRSFNSKIERLTKSNGILIKTFSQELGKLTRIDPIKKVDVFVNSFNRIVKSVQAVNRETLELLPSLHECINSAMMLCQRSISMFEARGEMSREVAEATFAPLLSLLTSFEFVRTNLDSLQSVLQVDNFPGSALSVEQRKLLALTKDLSRVLDVGIREGKALEAMLAEYQS